MLRCEARSQLLNLIQGVRIPKPEIFDLRPYAVGPTPSFAQAETYVNQGLLKE